MESPCHVPGERTVPELQFFHRGTGREIERPEIDPDDGGSDRGLVEETQIALVVDHAPLRGGDVGLLGIVRRRATRR